MDKNKKYYCRCCGANKGHNFDKCENFREMRDIMKNQDGQIGDTMQLTARISELEKDRNRWEQATRGADRLVSILVDAYERLRSKAA
jgi:hypothetical protein